MASATFAQTSDASGGYVEAGKKLREELETSFADLKRSGKLSGSLLGNDITPTVARYVHDGMGFEAAENILKAAGFRIDKPDSAALLNRSKRPSDWEVVATIPKFAGQFLAYTSAYVHLIPPALGDYSTVVSFKAVMVTSTL